MDIIGLESALSIGSQVASFEPAPFDSGDLGERRPLRVSDDESGGNGATDMRIGEEKMGTSTWLDSRLCRACQSWCQQLGGFLRRTRGASPSWALGRFANAPPSQVLSRTGQ